MAIAIPALTTTQLAALQAEFAVPRPPYMNINRATDLLRNFTGLIDASALVITGIHGAADATNDTTAADATDQATGDTLANEIKADYNAHRVLTAGGVHAAADATNVVTAANGAGTEGALQTLVNDIRTQLLAHLPFLTSDTHGVADPNIPTLAAATDLASDIALANHLKAIYNAHILNINGLSTTVVADIGAFTTVDALAGSTVTFDGNITAALATIQGTILSNTTGAITLTAALPAVPVSADTYTAEFSAIDAQLVAMDGGRALGSSQSNPYGNGPLFIDACINLLDRIGTVPAFLTIAAAEPNGIGSPHAGGASAGLISAAMDEVSAAVAAYTAPA